MKAAALHARADLVGAGLSAACAVHCLAVPVWIAMAPVAGIGFLCDPATDAAVVAASLALAATSLAWGVRRHGDWRVFLPLAAGAAFLAWAWLPVLWGYAESGCAVCSASPEAPRFLAAALGGVSVSAAHLINRRRCRSCEACRGAGGDA